MKFTDPRGGVKSVSFQKKDRCSHGHASFYWYATDSCHYSLVGELRIVSKTGVLLNPLYDQINMFNYLGEGVFFKNEITIVCCKIKSGLHLIIEGVKYDFKNCPSRSRLLGTF